MSESTRPFFNAPIRDLESMGNDPAISESQLRNIVSELNVRQSKRAKDLQDRLEKHLAETEGGNHSYDSAHERRGGAYRTEGDAFVRDEKSQVASEQIERLRKRLLDLTNRNKLLNFRHPERSRSYVRVIDELPDLLYEKLKSGGALTFKALPEPEDEPADEHSDDFLIALEEARQSDEDYSVQLKKIGEEADLTSKEPQEVERRLKDRVREQLGMPRRQEFSAMSRAEFAAHHGFEPTYELPKARPGENQAKHTDNEIQTLLLPDEMERKLSGVHDQARTSLEESGVNTLYCAFGFLEWYETRESSPMRAPLLLFPIEIQRLLQASEYRYSIRSSDEEPQANITLIERLKQDFGIALPDLQEDESPESYFLRVQEAVKDKKKWRLIRWITIGHFAFARLVMYQDFNPESWPGTHAPSNQPVVSELLGGTDRKETFYAEEYDVDNPEIENKVPALIDDADSSQFSAMVDVMEGKNLAIKGPPGTGKSQTITNIIAAAMAAGTRVLFVAEKMAALDVVKNRLDAAGLGEFVFELHSTKTRKREVLDRLESRLEIQGTVQAPKNLQEKIKELQELRRDLNEYSRLINQEVGSLGKTLNEIMWAEQGLREDRRIPAGVKNLRLDRAWNLTGSEVDKIQQHLHVIQGHEQQFVESYGCVEKHPWYGMRKPSLGPLNLSTVIQTATELQELLEGLLEGVEELQREINCHWDMTQEQIDCFSKNVTQIRESCREDGADLRLDILAATAEEDTYHAMSGIATDLKRYKQASERIGSRVLDKDWAMSEVIELQKASDYVNHLGLSASSAGEVDELVEAAKDQALKWKRLCNYAKRLLEAVGVEAEPAAEYLDKIKRAIRLLEQVDRQTLLAREDCLTESDNTDRLAKAKEQANALRDSLAKWEEEFEIPLDDPDLPSKLRSDAATLRNASWLSLVRSATRRARKGYFLLRRRYQFGSNQKIARELDEIAGLIAAVQAFRSDSNLRKVCGRNFDGIESDFDRFIAVGNFASEVRRTVGGDKLGRHLRGVLLEQPVEKLDDLIALGAEPERTSLEDEVARLLHSRGNFEGYEETTQEQYRKMSEVASVVEGIRMPEEVQLGELGAIAEEVEIMRSSRAGVRERIEFARAIDPNYEPFGGKDAQIIATVGLAEVIKEGTGWWSPIGKQLLSREFEQRLASLETHRDSLVEQLRSVRDVAARIDSEGQVNEEEYYGGKVEELPIRRIWQRTKDSVEASDALQMWSRYQEALCKVREHGLEELLAMHKGDKNIPEALPQGFMRVLYNDLIEQAFEKAPRLKRFSGVEQGKLQERFRSVDKEILNLQQKQLRADLAKREIDQGTGVGRKSNYSGLRLIKWEVGKKKKFIPIRDLLARAGTAIQQMKPCFMMSPLSVAQFLKQGAIDFDLVVIDEASQMRPEDSLGALARTKQAVIVGDPMQLPPTQFFERNEGLEDEEDYEEEIDSESVLDLGLAVYRPARSLRWHYRSRHGSLIAFSNRYFYDDNLIVFPAPLEDHNEYGVRLVPVEGHFQKRVNVQEAQKVAREVIQFMKEHADKSLGVVTLNQPQRELLVDEIRRLIAHDKDAQEYEEKWLAWQGGLRSFFVKNLETVQGDERDVIFISTVYGPDPQTGKPYQRFGPINSRDGHRRLNVLFTRARERVVVFSAMRPSDIRVDGKASRGVKALRDYLEFAETGRLERGEIGGREPESEFEECVKEWLEREGYTVAPQVGVKGYFIDLGIRDPAKPNRFLLGVECDGAMYHSGKSARDRDRLRQEILESLGWNIYRIWSSDWFGDPRAQMRKLVNHIEKLRAR